MILIKILNKKILAFCLLIFIILPLYFFNHQVYLYSREYFYISFCFLFIYLLIFSRLPHLLQELFSCQNKYSIKINTYKNSILGVLFPIFLIHILLSYFAPDFFALKYFITDVIIFIMLYIYFIILPLKVAEHGAKKAKDKTDKELNKHINEVRFDCFLVSIALILDNYYSNTTIFSVLTESNLTESNYLFLIVFKTALIIILIWLDIIFQGHAYYDGRNYYIKIC